MARVVKLTPRFAARLSAANVVRGSGVSQAIGATLAALAEAEHLPGLLDTIAAIPPTGRAFVRRVAGRNLWLWYHLTEAEVVPVTVTKHPPVPVDE